MDRRTALAIGLIAAGLLLVGFSGSQLLLADTGSQATPGPSAIPSASQAAPGSAQPSTGTQATPPPSRPTLAPSPTTVSSVTPDPEEAVRAFFADLVAAIRAGNEASMLDRLHPTVLDRYGAATCQAKLDSDRPDPSYAVEIVAITPLAPWDYVTDDLTTSIDAAWTVTADVVALGQASRREIHVAPVNGVINWFTDCGTPRANP